MPVESLEQLLLSLFTAQMPRQDAIMHLLQHLISYQFWNNKL